MPIQVRFTEADLTKLHAKLEGIARGEAKTLLEEPLKKSAAPWVERWKRTAPQPGSSGYTGPGKRRKRGGPGLADAIGSKVISAKDQYVLILIVGANYGVAPHEHLAERGHEMVVHTQGQQTRGDRGRYTSQRTATPANKSARSAGRVQGRWVGSAAGEYTAAIRSHILFSEVGRAVEQQLKV